MFSFTQFCNLLQFMIDESRKCFVENKGQQIAVTIFFYNFRKMRYNYKKILLSKVVLFALTSIAVNSYNKIKATNSLRTMDTYMGERFKVMDAERPKGETFKSEPLFCAKKRVGIRWRDRLINHGAYSFYPAQRGRRRENKRLLGNVRAGRRAGRGEGAPTRPATASAGPTYV